MEQSEVSKVLSSFPERSHLLIMSLVRDDKPLTASERSKVCQNLVSLGLTPSDITNVIINASEFQQELSKRLVESISSMNRRVIGEILHMDPSMDSSELLVCALKSFTGKCPSGYDGYSDRVKFSERMNEVCKSPSTPMDDKVAMVGLAHLLWSGKIPPFIYSSVSLRELTSKYKMEYLNWFICRYTEL